MPAEEWMREFLPYGTPCDEPCEPAGAPSATSKIEELQAQINGLRAELEALKAAQGEPARKSGTDS
jgi:serine O-acetyltransferase